MITPHIVDSHNNVINAREKARAIRIENVLDNRADEIDTKVNDNFKDANSFNGSNNNVSNDSVVNQSVNNPALSAVCAPGHPANSSNRGC